jgi:hypothetical protein
MTTTSEDTMRAQVEAFRQLKARLSEAEAVEARARQQRHELGRLRQQHYFEAARLERLAASLRKDPENSALLSPRLAAERAEILAAIDALR